MAVPGLSLSGTMLNEAPTVSEMAASVGESGSCPQTGIVSPTEVTWARPAARAFSELTESLGIPKSAGF